MSFGEIKTPVNIVEVLFSFSDLTMDHVVPQFYGGEKTWENIVAACKRCNGKKGHKKLEEISMNLLTKPKNLL